MAACGSTIQYTGADEAAFTCSLPPGHKGPHYDATSRYGMTWTHTFAAEMVKDGT